MVKIKNLIYSVYALFFNVFSKLFDVKKNRAAFVSMHNENFNDSLGGVFEYLKNLGGFDFVFISRRDLDIKPKNIPRVFSFFFVKSRKLATSKYVFLNDNFMPMAKLNFRPEAVIVQLWHAEGIFKKFGLDVNRPESVRKNEIGGNEKLSFVVCSSKSVVPYYARAFGKSVDKVAPLGSPRTDFFFKSGAARRARERLLSLYPELENKKLVLYAPTFRDEPEKNGDILSHFDVELFNRELSGEYALLARLHPQIHERESLSGAVDVTEYDDVRELALACDALVTDYSSICMDFSLLDKKTVFFAYDLEEYIKTRDFYCDYASYVPGEVATDTEGVIKAIKAPFDREKNEKFKRFNFDYADGESAKRVVEYSLSFSAKKES